MHYGIEWEEYLNSVVFDGIDELHKTGESLKPGFFSYQVIQNVPYIQYAGLTEEENRFALRMAEEVLIRAKRENNYNEVSIVYNYKNPEDVAIVFGDEDSVKFMSDNKTQELIQTSGPLIVMSFHNRPNNAAISFDDLAIFCLSSQIRVMGIINHHGELSYIERHDNVDLVRIFAMCVNAVIGSNTERNLQSLSAETKNQITEALLSELQKIGIQYHGWDSKAMAFQREQSSITLEDDLEQEHDLGFSKTFRHNKEKHMSANFQISYRDFHNTPEHIESFKKALAFLDTIQIPMIAFVARAHEYSLQPIPIEVITDTEEHEDKLVDLFGDYNAQNSILDNTGLFVSHDEEAAATGFVLLQKGMRL